MKIEAKIEEGKLVLSHKWNDWQRPNTTIEQKTVIPLSDISEIIEKSGPKGGFRGVDILSKELNSYLTSNGFYEKYNKILKGYGIYDRDADELYKDLSLLLTGTGIKFSTYVDKY